ncbi:Gryzun, putative trafficking through golgi-domain-containing protein [Cadophora sp. MPI-SDFR-AT-0126]|nr:Gryzun, putative trafficking through golgi-domain-containing protein [Leotiomycetes sp. MPI-SDFR-AT-0126]
MDGYAPAYVAHNIPLLVVSGLGPGRLHDVQLEGGTRISSEIPTVESDDALALLKIFKDGDASDLAWNAREHSGRNKFKVKTVGREYILPPRSAQLPAEIPTSPTSKPVLHSVLSPLSPGSRLFPDGLLDSAWIEKHQDQIPSAFILFYTFTSDPNLSTLHDNQLKTDINSTKSILNQSGYKTRMVVALLSEKSIVQSPDVEERLANIRKATGLDSKTSFFFLPPQSSAVELQAFVETIITTIYPICIEYYRDLSKHSRRKRNRGVVPPPTAPPTSGTSQTLSSQGWNVRYDFKLGIFAEFRQEMDSAVRSFESGYEVLLGPDVLEAIASWSPRWNEARLLADVFAFRIVRCLLWNGNSTAAVRRWQSHRERIRDFVDRRGKGSSTYGWQAWEARWATVMAEMIKKVSFVDLAGQATFLQAEKTIAIGERIQPWEYLHHPGYWFRTAATHLMARRALAQAIPQEDRSPPGSSPASHIASKAYTYDTYLCPEPHEENPLPGRPGIDHPALIIDTLAKAIYEFQKRGQSRVVQELQLLSAKESMKREAWEDAVHILRPLWQKMSYRREGWWNAVEEVGWALRKAAVCAGDGGSVIAVDWELMNRSFTHHSGWPYDLSKSLEGLDTVKTKPAVALHDHEINSFLSATYTFEQSEGKVGEPCFSQLAVSSHAVPSAAPVTIAEIKIVFEGSMKPVVISHQEGEVGVGESNQISLRTVSLTESAHESQPTLIGEATLIFRPGETKIFEFSSILREAGEATAVSATFSMATDLFDLEYINTFSQTNIPDVWWGEQSIKKRIVRANAASIVILPKPPKIQLRLLGLREQYYMNEQIVLQVEVTNGEEVDTVVNLEVRLLGEDAPPIMMKLGGTEVFEAEDGDNASLAGTPIGRIASTASTVVEIIIPSLNLPAVYELAMKSAYNLVSDMETPVYQSMSMQLEIINPFEANYDFSPRIHPYPWPSLFTHEEGVDSAVDEEVSAQGLAQKWCLTARYASFAVEELIVEDIDVEIIGSNGGITCYTEKLTKIPESGLRVAPKSLEEALFDVFTQKISLDDRGTATLDISLSIKWRRDGEGSPMNTTVLAVPRLLVSSSEPRVLASVSYSTKLPSMIHFDVTIENPSNHFLTFGLTMEPSEKFAFSGVKSSTLQLVPLSRRTMRFRLLPTVRGEWIGPIHCVIRDRYFQKVLKIAPTEGMKVEKEGILVWVPAEDDF